MNAKKPYIFLLLHKILHGVSSFVNFSNDLEIYLCVMCTQNDRSFVHYGTQDDIFNNPVGNLSINRAKHIIKYDYIRVTVNCPAIYYIDHSIQLLEADLRKA